MQANEVKTVDDVIRNKMLETSEGQLFLIYRSKNRQEADKALLEIEDILKNHHLPASTAKGLLKFVEVMIDHRII